MVRDDDLLLLVESQILIPDVFHLLVDDQYALYQGDGHDELHCHQPLADLLSGKPAAQISLENLDGVE